MPKYKIPSGIELFYETYLSTDMGGSPWVIFISGHGDSSVIWTDYAKKFNTGGYNVLIFDNRDGGQSSLSLDAYTLNDLADDVLSLMAGLKIESAHLIGHSMGATIAQLISLKNPKSVSSLTLMAGAASRRFINLDLINSWISVFRSGLKDDIEPDDAYHERLRQMLPFAFSHSFLADTAKIDPLIAAAKAYPHRQKFSAYARQFSAIAAVDEVKNNYKGPVLLISGAEDRVVFPDAQVELLEQFPQAKHIVIPAALHCLNIEASEKCQTEILGFLSAQRLSLAHYVSPASGTSDLTIPRGVYLSVLRQVEDLLPELLSSADWKTVDVDYHPPRVERVWLQYGSLRINLHRIHAAKSSETLFHKHPWPSAMRVLEGTYEMGLGFGVEETAPPLAATIMLNEGTSYEMTNPNGWHYVSPVSEVSYSLMVSGCPWPGREKKSSLRLGELSVEAKEEILTFFRRKYPKKTAEIAARGGAGGEVEVVTTAAKAGAEGSDHTYIFSATDYERERLKRLNDVYNPHTKSLLATYLKPGMDVFEVGLGTGEIAEWISQQTGAAGGYAAIDISDENFTKIMSKIPSAKLIKGSVVDFDATSSLGDRKFDIVFFRWVLGYTPKDKHVATLKKLYQLLKPGGRLICEEFNLYAAHCVDARDRTIRISHPAFTEWVALSRKVDEKFDANFGLGGTIVGLLEEVAEDPALLTTTRFQGLFDSHYKKQILSLGMKSARDALLGAGIKRTESYDSLTTALDHLAETDAININYIEDTAIVVLRR